jgi:hypothetical protein
MNVLHELEMSPATGDLDKCKLLDKVEQGGLANNATDAYHPRVDHVTMYISF